jgi:hypothetical protein
MMEWVEKVLDQLDQSLEWQSLGKLSWRFDEEDNHLRLAPALMEMSGGADDGQEVYPFYSLDVSSLIEVFDKPPSMSWSTMTNEFSLEGPIGGNDSWITFCRDPFDDDEPQDMVDPDGGIRQKK